MFNLSKACSANYLRAVFISVLPVLSCTAHAQSTYPDHPVRLIVPQSAGSGADVVARLLGEKIGSVLGASVVVENKPGANGIVATSFVAKSPADGYILLLAGVSQMSFNPKLYKTLPYDANKDFTYIAPVVDTPFVLVAGKSSPYKTLPQLLAAAKAAPDSVTFASAGAGNSTHLSTEMIAAGASIKLKHVPYKGSGPALNAVIGGQVDIMTSVLGSALPQIQGGNVIPLAVLADKRASDLPDVPTLKEAGIQAPPMPGWFAVVGPAGMDNAIVSKLNQAIQAAITDPAINKRLKDLYFIPLQGTAQEMRARADEDAKVWGDFIARTGVQVD
ncbi:tripartite tricarboxylate transporter substrate binding protein [Achromobacter seleniivolatilans]|uniref:Tripartite tricarboxylate transporter substrate binding protein n=1 Tax=Achromobacter seleniivolatilans TaxID=3047478 RepID=A0ABY9M549_9BURK|nr:tripartite tricarboxylate transporter substrate binding protein [Achromobacter sp. R39]WMD22119.1 tripartite tricarboxylate transporter substrate binding protein [Achromobacter sp. R39]